MLVFNLILFIALLSAAFFVVFYGGKDRDTNVEVVIPGIKGVIKINNFLRVLLFGLLATLIIGMALKFDLVAFPSFG